MRSDPERMAIRVKLLEVYAKRRDAKGFELLATQVRTLTRGSGDDWAKVQALGLTVDPANPLYQAPGASDEGPPSLPAVDPLAATTLPEASPPPGPAPFEPAPDATLDVGHVDLALDIDAPPPPVPGPAPAPPPAAADQGLDFDLGALDLPPAPAPAQPPAQAPAGALDFGSFGVDEPAAPAMDPALAAALERKLDLAEEFRQIGDLEGARDLLEEVVAKADGALKAKAQGMLDAL
jgi:pilus assembly protein FimV